ncbi:hypothetical protein AXI64_gp193 [Vibrio phage qdvp001]|nr:hypothetical protein AXI64_gp193 [Vibrio phage qdvp001]ALM62185.1 hypothetical protein qdvp001_193 [Vibrio phage qdvp001]
MYLILKVEDTNNIHLRFITGEDSYHVWNEKTVQEDIVVM